MSSLENQCTILNTVSVPSTVSQFLQPLEINDENSLHSGFKTVGGITSNLKYAWIVNGARFQVIDIRTGNRLASWLFSGFFRNKKSYIRCVVELPDNISENIPLFIIGLECELNGGLICIFDVIGSKILKVIQIDFPVSSLYVVDPGYKLNEFLNLLGMLKTLDGVLAVGTDGGDTYLMDLCRDIWSEDSNTLVDDLNWSKLVIRSCKNLNLGLLETYKTLSAQNQNHLALQLNELSSPNIFTLTTPQGKGKALDLRRSEVQVSSLLYVPKLVSLFVGYNFGAWQIYNLLTLELEYTSAVYEELVPISHFAYQEPSDDPREFCYVWAVYSHDSGARHSNVPLAALYALAYETKENIEDYGILYQKLNSCSLRFQMDLTPLNDSSECKGGYCLAMQSYVNPTNLDHNADQRLTLCMLVWCVWPMDYDTNPEIIMAIFDLDQWYKEQMPATIKDDEKDTYLAQFNLNELLPVEDGDCPILDVKIDQSTISSFLTTQRLEEHYYPSALAFDFICMQNSRFTYIKNYGVQRKLLLMLEENGPEIFLKPEILTQECIRAGLQPINTDVTPRLKPSPRSQLLSIALEHNLIKLLTTCAQQWATGAFASFGCTLGMFVEWACQRSETLQQKANELCVSLFDYSDINLDCNARQILDQCAKQMRHLAAIFKIISKTCANDLNEQGRTEIDEELRAIEMFSDRLDVLQWLLNVGLLPEAPASAYVNPIDSSGRLRAPYPADALTEYYNKRRRDLNQLCGIPSVNAASTPCELLFIDNLIEYEFGGERLRSEWRQDATFKNRSGLYPPNSIQALLRTYLIDNVNIEIKHTILVYVFLDLAMTLDRTKYANIITHLIKFPAVFRLTPCHIKMTQAFWQLDHGDFETGMEQILDPLTSGIGQEEFKSWQHRTVLRMLLANQEHKYAALYIQIRQPSFSDVNEICDAINLLLMNDMLHTAFEFQRRHRTNQNKNIILKKFFEGCQKTNLLISALKLSYTKEEEEVLIDILKRDPKHGSNLLLVYLLQRSRGYEAIGNNDRSLDGSQLGLSGQHAVELPEILLNMYMKAMPKISRSIFENFRLNHNQIAQSDPPNNEECKPTPLSISVKNENHMKYKSNFISESIVKIREIWKTDTKSGELESMPFLCTPKRKQIVRPVSVPIVYPKMIYREDATSKKRPTDLQDDDISLEHHPNKRLKTVCGEAVPIKHTATEKLALTPIVKRKTADSDTINKVSENRQTPQSILKVKRAVNSNTSNDSNHITKAVTRADSVLLKQRSLRERSIDKDDSIQPSDSTVTKIFAPTPRKSLVRTPRPVVHFEDTLTDTSPEELKLTSNDIGVKKDSSMNTPEKSEEVFYSTETTPTESENAVNEALSTENKPEICKTVQEEVSRITRKLSSPYRPYSSIKPRKSLERKVLETSLAKTIAPVLTKVVSNQKPKSRYSLRSSLSSEPDSNEDFADNVPCASSPLKSNRPRRTQRTKKVRTKVRNSEDREIKRSDEEIHIKSLSDSELLNDTTETNHRTQDPNNQSLINFINSLESSELSESAINRVRARLRAIYGTPSSNQTTDSVFDSVKPDNNEEIQKDSNKKITETQDTIFIHSLESSELSESQMNRVRAQLKEMYGPPHNHTDSVAYDTNDQSSINQTVESLPNSGDINEPNTEMESSVLRFLKKLEDSDMSEAEFNRVREIVRAMYNRTDSVSKSLKAADNTEIMEDKESLKDTEKTSSRTDKVEELESSHLNESEMNREELDTTQADSFDVDVKTNAQFESSTLNFLRKLEDSYMSESEVNRIRAKLRATYGTNSQSSINQTVESLANSTNVDTDISFDEISKTDTNEPNAEMESSVLRFLKKLEDSDMSEAEFNRVREIVRATYRRVNDQSSCIDEDQSAAENFNESKKSDSENDFIDFQPSPTSDSFFLKLAEDSEASSKVIKTIQEKLFENDFPTKTSSSNDKQEDTKQEEPEKELQPNIPEDVQDAVQKNIPDVQETEQQDDISEKVTQEEGNIQEQCSVSPKETVDSVSVVNIEIGVSQTLVTEESVVEEVVIEKITAVEEVEPMEVDEDISGDGEEQEETSSDSSNKQNDSNGEEDDSNASESEENSESSENEENVEDVKPDKNEIIEISSESEESESNGIEEVEEEEEEYESEPSEEYPEEEEHISEKSDNESPEEDESNSSSSGTIKIGKDSEDGDSVKSYTSNQNDADNKEPADELQEEDVHIKVDNPEFTNQKEISNSIPQTSLYERDPLLTQSDEKLETNLEQPQNIDISLEQKNILTEDVSCLITDDDSINVNQSEIKNDDLLLSQTEEKIEDVPTEDIYTNLETSENITVDTLDKNVFSGEVSSYLITDDDDDSKVIESTTEVLDPNQITTDTQGNENEADNQIVNKVETITEEKLTTEKVLEKSEPEEIRPENENTLENDKETVPEQKTPIESESKTEQTPEPKEIPSENNQESVSEQKIQTKSESKTEGIPKSEEIRPENDKESVPEQQIQIERESKTEGILEPKKIGSENDQERVLEQNIQSKSESKIEETPESKGIRSEIDQKGILEQKIQTESEIRSEKLSEPEEIQSESRNKSEEQIEESVKSTTKVQVKRSSRKKSTDSSTSEILAEIPDKPLTRSRRAKSLTTDIPDVKEIEEIVPKTRRGRSLSLSENKQVDTSLKTTGRTRRSRTKSPQSDHNSLINIAQLNTIKEQDEEEETSKIPEKNIKEKKSNKKEQNLLEEYSSSRRLTRKQKVLLEKSLESSKMNISVEKLTPVPEETENEPGDLEKKVESSPTASTRSNSSSNTERVAIRSRARTSSTEPTSPTVSRKIRRTRAGSVDIIMETKKPQKISSSASDILATPTRRSSRRLSQTSEISEKDDSETGSVSSRTRKRSASVAQNTLKDEREIRRSPRRSKDGSTSSSQSSLSAKTSKKSVRRSVLDALIEEKGDSSQNTEDSHPTPAKRTRKQSRSK